MKIVVLIIGLVFAVVGLGLTVFGWYEAASAGRIVEGSAYAGPFLLIVGVWRVLASAAAVAPPSIFRIVAVVIGIAAGFGNLTAQKAAFPSDKVITSHTPQ